MPTEAEILVLEDRAQPGQWRVEYIDEDGGCYVTIFAGPAAQQRAHDYGEALKAGSLSAHTGPLQLLSNSPAAAAK
jgi:hypothetical protein